MERYDSVKSIGHEHTFEQDLADQGAIKATLLALSAKVGRRLRQQGYKARVIHLKLRYLDFSTYSRQLTIGTGTDFDGDIFGAAEKLFDTHFDGRPVRLVGVSAHQLTPRGQCPEQLDLFTPLSEKKRQLASVMDKIKDRHGEKSITYGLVTEHEEV